MATIVIVGPEKSGKTTLCKEIAAQAQLAGFAVDYQHRTGKKPFTRADAMMIMQHDHSGMITIFDRAWPCAVVYESFGFSQLYSAMREEAERTVGRFVREGNGATVVLLGPSPEELESKRTSDDWPIAPSAEQEAYKAYGEQHGWRIIADYTHDREALRELAADILSRARH